MRQQISTAFLFLAVVAIVIAILTVPSDDRRSALDLPVAHAGSVIEYFGADFSADCFVWCIDRSASMGWNGALQTVQAETTDAINQLDPVQELGLVAFSSNTVIFTLDPIPAIPANQAAAIGFLNSLVASGSTCMEFALLSSLDIAEASTLPDRAILLVYDGPPICNGTDTSAAVLANVTSNNLEFIPIHVIYLGTDAAGVAFGQQLAALNNGSFLQVPGGGGPSDLFLRGDADHDGNVDGLVDALFILAYQFTQGSPEPPCLDAADVDDDGTINGIVDALALLGYQFSGGEPPPFPGPISCGLDPTADAIDCVAPPVCP